MKLPLTMIATVLLLPPATAPAQDYPEGVLITTEPTGTPWQVIVTAEVHVQGVGGRVAVRPANVDLQVSVGLSRQLWLEGAVDAAYHQTGVQEIDLPDKPGDLWLLDATVYWAPGDEHGGLLLGGGAWFVLSEDYRETFDTVATPHLEVGAQLVVEPGFAIMGTAGMLITTRDDQPALPWFQLGMGWAF